MIKILNKWHTYLDMPKYDSEWHIQDMEDELQEYKEAHGIVSRWSELSDVVYTYSRGQWSEHKTITFPLNKLLFCVGVVYMIPKYTLRWKFFRELGYSVGSEKEIHEVRNPEKEHKMDDIAERYNIDPSLFKSEAMKLKKRKFFLK